MSDSFLRIIPVEPSFVPAAAAVDSAVARLHKALPAARAIEARSGEEVALVDAGVNLRSVVCPACGEEIDTEWWGESVTHAAEGGFAALEICVPCCGAETSLDELVYDMPQGFARFVLEVSEPSVARLPVSVVKALAETLGCSLRVAWSRY